MAEEIAHQGEIYRSVGGEIHRRPLFVEGLALWKRSWLVLNHDEFIPQEVRTRLAEITAHASQLRFE